MAGERSHRHNRLIPKLIRLHSPDLLDLRTLSPENPENFCILVQAIIGLENESGEESFDFIVCSVKWLHEFLSDKSFVFGRHYLIVSYYNYDIIWDAINTLCQKIPGGSWKEIAEQLGKYGRWEFEDYVAYDSSDKD